MAIIKKFTPRPSDEDDNSLGKIELTDFVLEASTEDLNEMDQASVIKLFVTLLKNHEEKTDLLIATQVETKVYSFMHSKYQQIKIGYHFLMLLAQQQQQDCHQVNIFQNLKILHLVV